MAKEKAPCDMIVNLYALAAADELPEGVAIERAFAGDKQRLLAIVRVLAPGWLGEVEAALCQMPPSCLIAYLSGKPVGFACYDATAKGYFGPTGVLPTARGKHIGKALLIKTLYAMREAGYGYAIIGWAEDAAPFYEKTVGARFIEGGTPENTVYSRMMRMQKKR